uniref:E3 ubiquitin-protein ligase TRIM39-like n=1 Tax=Cyprinus carpio TaxID=7962 RepID=A0A8C1P9U2_CYPCA
MSSSISSLSEEIQCSICRDVFIDPVSTPCGHNFCKICLNKYWDNSQTCSCPYCQETFKQRPDLKINTTLRELVDHYKKKSPEKTTEKDMQLMIQNRIKKIQDIKHSAEVRKSGEDLFTDLIRSIQRHQTELLEVMEEQQKAAEKQEQVLIEELEQEITELKMRNTELENWPEISMKTHESLETLRRALTQLKDTIDEKLTQTVDVTLDPDTAHPKLILSDDGKQVRHGDIRQKLPNKPERFDPCPCVLGKEGFSSGRFYFEVQVKGKTDWDLGVARESINRKGMITLRPSNGYWTVILRNGDEYKTCENRHVTLSLRVKPQRVGVFVDYEEGLVSFYDVESSSHIYSFTAQSFTEKLYPYFCPCNNDGSKNSSPLIITPVAIRGRKS